jgi:hypothetical protein
LAIHKARICRRGRAAVDLKVEFVYVAARNLVFG